jgi:NADP-reducing hydrogenase subunit HndB
MVMTKEELLKMKDDAIAKRPKNWIRVGYSTCGIAAGAKEALDALIEAAKAHNLDIEISKCGCLGLCSAEPLVEVNVEGAPRVFYGKVTRDIAHKIIDKHVCQKKLVDGHIFEI